MYWLRPPPSVRRETSQSADFLANNELGYILFGTLKAAWSLAEDSIEERVTENPGGTEIAEYTSKFQYPHPPPFTADRDIALGTPLIL